ncbi:MAG: flagellar transcriptional regulator FlhD [Burkholderiales bacterium]|nr:flagellar transcriptional regulator FlhD [Burkholderiales bacterium]MBY0576820.1 flagellar transcriptional regulator FlhD [Gallionellaceae bacterium]
MTPEQMTEEIREVNLSYMLLAKQMVQQDKATAIYRLGISKEVADIIENLTHGQILKMVGANLLLCRFRVDDRLILEMLANHSRSHAMSQSHAAILMAGQPLEQVA